MIGFISSYLLSFFNAAVSRCIKNDVPQNEKLGEGSFSIIEKHFDKELDKFVVHKIAKNKREDSLATEFLEIEWHALFLFDHPNIPKVYYMTKHTLVMEYLPGKDLYYHIVSKTLSDRKDLDTSRREIKNIFTQLCKCISYVHSLNYVHCDLKPENIMYDQLTAHIKIIDWGFAKKVEEIDHRDARGSLFYVAPEVVFDIDSRHIGKENDVWALGIILYVVSSGFMPYSSSENVLEQIKAYDIYWDRPNLTHDLKTFLAKILVPYTVRPTIDELLKDEWFS